jgi:hypothetical protein
MRRRARRPGDGSAGCWLTWVRWVSPPRVIWGSAQPAEAMEKVFADHQFDEIIVATLPRPVSRWLRADLPHRAERRFGLPVTTIMTKRWP